MNLIAIIVILIVLGIIAWAADRYLPLQQPFKGIVLFLIILVGCLLLLNAAGVLGGLSGVGP